MSKTRKIRLSYLIFTILLFSIGVLAFTYQQMPNYFKKDLISYDECTNAVVSNNLYRDAFPPKLRLNPLNSEYMGWKEGPGWQHIPPLFSYVPFIFYYMDGGPTIEVRRLSYVLVAFLQGLIFIIGISWLFKEKRAILMAAVASYLWVITPFTRGVLNGNYFGYSDIVLACSVTLSLLLTIAVFQNIRRKTAINGHLLAIAIIASVVPILVKNVLGGLPMLFLVLVLYDGMLRSRIRKSEFILSFLVPLSICAVYYGACLWKSPDAFKAEFFVSFRHFGNYEGWKKPFHYFVSNYLPKRYFQFMWWPFVAGLVFSIFTWNKMQKPKQKNALSFLLIYFAANLVIISFVTSKSANFILQGYLFILFFVCYVVWDKLLELAPTLKLATLLEKFYDLRRSIGIIVFTIFTIMLIGNIYKMHQLRNTRYHYASQNERFFQFGELCQNVLYANTKTLFIIDTDTSEYAPSQVYQDPDYWLRYYILYNSGSEARRIEEVKDFKNKFDVQNVILKKYDRVYLVASDATIDSKYSQEKYPFEKVGNYSVHIIRKKHLPKFIQAL